MTTEVLKKLRRRLLRKASSCKRDAEQGCLRDKQLRWGRYQGFCQSAELVKELIESDESGETLLAYRRTE